MQLPANLLLAVMLTVSIQAVTRAASVTVPVWDTYSDTWVATDDLGRSLPTYVDVDGPKSNKSVGIFYFLWIDGRGGVVNDNSKILARNPNHVFSTRNGGGWGWWGKPMLGYYVNRDPWVLAKHAQMLRDAGIDTLFFDSSNGFTHPKQVVALAQEFEHLRQLGNPTPDFAHLTHNHSGKTVQQAYNELYGKNLYPDLWYRWDGKPIALGMKDDIPPTLQKFFTVRESWAWSSGKWFGNGYDRWPWLDNYPQRYGWHVAPNVPEQISVCAAQHATTAIGRSFHNGHEPPADQRDPRLGLNFAEQWKQALKVSPRFVFVTGWNEWIAPMQDVKKPGEEFLGHKLNPGDGFFVDEYSPEFSRNCEPSDGVLKDDYYMQLVANIRRYKGVRRLPNVSPRPVKIDGQFTDWTDVTPEFRDAIGDVTHRDHAGFAKGSKYVNNTGRNDIVAAKVSEDQKAVYFYVRTNAPITPHTDPNWMLLYLNTDHNSKTGWMGYDYVINRVNVTDHTTTLQRNIGGRYDWQTMATVPYQMVGNQMELSIPRRLLGLNTSAQSIDFKWADNPRQNGRWDDFYLNGDAAPNGRFNYRAKLLAE